ncbi:MAG TPA: FUSC family protein [Actinoplanes sp.]|nr:FUSC family protein [Actinoplanes sp.]
MSVATEPVRGRRFAAFLARLGSRSRSRASAGGRRVRAGVALAVQAGLAAGLAWFVSHDILGSVNPFFAPIAAVITLAVSVGRRLRRAAELIIGVAIGISVGAAAIVAIGTGPWQIGLLVFLTIVAAYAVGTGSSLIVQSASSAVLVATLTAGGLPYGRFVDALVGGLVGLTVMAVLLPLNPLTVVRRAADPALDTLADGLHDVAAALTDRDVQRIEGVLERLRKAESEFAAFAAGVSAAGENSAVAPARWRSREALAHYVDSADHITYALRNIRVLIRRVLTALGDDEPIPPVLPTALGLLGDAVELLREELAEGVEPVATRERALRATVETGRAYDHGVGFSGAVVVAQVRSTVVDLLQATGVDSAEAKLLVRRAISRHERRAAQSASGRARGGPPGLAAPDHGPDARGAA